MGAMPNGPAARSVPGDRSRLYPAGKAVLLLGVCAPQLAGRRMSIEGRTVRAMRFDRLVLLVAYVDQHAYAPERVASMREQPAWLATEARVLERAVERARLLGTVLPARLLAAFPHQLALEAHARDHATRWSRALARLGAKRECVVHLYAGPHAPPGGDPYVVRIAQNTARTGRPPSLGNDAVAVHAARVWRDVAALGIATRRVSTGGRRGALWSAVVLLGDGDVGALGTLLERSAAGGVPLGVTAYLEAPRPPYCFV